eukprot:TRINITY_DN4920_c0_g1_i1.p2 TRINITY_DN4920_c0_g1~~TRINITY_DN4920_c0_g1_i1.p2  ORF type:complete len:209 (-),score=32.48 TRINITY_DN4920_c0_g1_i1:292-918(-)
MLSVAFICAVGILSAVANDQACAPNTGPVLNGIDLVEVHKYLIANGSGRNLANFAVPQPNDTSRVIEFADYDFFFKTTENAAAFKADVHSYLPFVGGYDAAAVVGSNLTAFPSRCAAKHPYCLVGVTFTEPDAFGFVTLSTGRSGLRNGRGSTVREGVKVPAFFSSAAQRRAITRHAEDISAAEAHWVHLMRVNDDPWCFNTHPLGAR